MQHAIKRKIPNVNHKMVNLKQTFFGGGKGVEGDI